MNSGGLADKAVLVKLRITTWATRKTDTRASREMADTKHADVACVRVQKELLNSPELRRVYEVARKARQYHYDHTLPWLDDGARILPGKGIMDYRAEMKQARREFETAVADFHRNFDFALAEAKSRLGDLFNPDDYPDPDAVKGKFTFEVSIDPVPSGDDFRLTLSEAEREELRADVEKRVRAAQETAMRDAWERLHAAVKRVVDSLPRFDPGKKGRERGTFRDTLITNIRELVDVLPTLNIVDDPELTAAVDAVRERLAHYDPDELREDEDKRKEAVEAAGEILTKVENVLGK